MDIKLIFKYYWPHIKKYKISGLLVFVMYFFAVIGSAILVPLLSKKIMDIVSTTQDPSSVASTLISTVIMLGIVIFSYDVFYRTGDYLLTFNRTNMLKDASDDAFNRIQKHSYEFFANTFTGSIVAQVKRYINAFEEIHNQVVFAVWMSGLRLIFSVVVLTYFSAILGGIFLTWVVLYVAMSIFFAKRKIKKDIKTAEASSKVTGVLADVLTNILNVKMFASSKKESSIFAKTTEKEKRYYAKAWNFQNLQFIFQGYFVGIFQFVGMYAAVTLWLNGSISAGTIILMQIYIFTSFEIVWNIGRNFTRVMRAFAEAKEMVDIFEEPLSVSDPVRPEKSKIKDGHIEIKDISFAYGGNEEVFTNFSLDIKQGEKVGLVGHSGSGKTTITKLLLRFADLKKGKIIIDGQDISKITQDDLRREMSYVPQDPVLFHRTLKENIAYAEVGDYSEEKIINAAKSSYAHEFINSLPLGYDTLVGERGIKLSGGERQRVAIARAVFKDAPILILDEATSSLDSISEKHIQDALDNLMKGRTTLVVAHRLSTIQKMDRIIVLENGKIKEEGTHKELIAKKGAYHELWKHQSHGFIEE
jgi:ATP-binding cassette, subfamily B, bacterial